MRINKIIPGTDISGYDSSKIQDSWRPSCPFCHALWTDDMIDLEDKGSGCDTCGYGGGTTIEITCSECYRLIYQKDTYWKKARLIVYILLLTFFLSTPSKGMSDIVMTQSISSPDKETCESMKPLIVKDYLTGKIKLGNTDLSIDKIIPLCIRVSSSGSVWCMSFQHLF